MMVSRVPIDVVLIHKIIGLPMQGPHPLEWVRKKHEEDTTTFVWKTYKVSQNKRGFVIQTINDPATQMGTRLLACKLMRKCQVVTVPTYVIWLAGRCTKGVSFNWDQYLCNEFLTNVCES